MRRISRPIVVLMEPTLFSGPLISLLNNNFGSEKFTFLLIGRAQAGFQAPPAPNIHAFARLRDMLVSPFAMRSILRAPQVIVNNCGNWPLIDVVASLNRKYVLVFWGGDLWALQSNAADISQRAYRRRCSLIERALAIGTLFRSDELLLRSLITELPPIFPLNLLTHQDETKVGEVLPTQATDSVPSMLLGNSATPTNRHKEVLEMLARRSEDFNVIVPLSYGDQEYANTIIEFGHEKLGDRFTPLTEFMPYPKYMEMLSSVDVGIFNSKRQQAMGNILAMLLRQKKVFLADDCVVAPELQAQGVTIFQVSSLSEGTIEDAISIDPRDQARNRAVVSAMRSERRTVELWRDLFRYCSDASSTGRRADEQ